MKKALIFCIFALILSCAACSQTPSEPPSRADIAAEGYAAALELYNSELQSKHHEGYSKTVITCFNHASYVGHDITVEVTEGQFVTYGEEFAREAMATYYYLFEDVRFVDYEEQSSNVMIYEYSPDTKEIKSCNSASTETDYGYTCDAEEFWRVRELNNFFLTANSYFTNFEIARTDASGITYSYLTESDSYGIYKADANLTAANLTLTDVYMGKAVTEIHNEAFKDCANLTGKLTIPDSYTSIGARAFAGCGFSEIISGNAVTAIGKNAFSENPVESITLGEALVAVEGNFSFPQLKSITFNAHEFPDRTDALFEFPRDAATEFSLTVGESVTRIPAYFINVNGNIWNDHGVKISSVTFAGESTCEYIGNNAFVSVYIDSLPLPNSLTEISSSAFYACSGLKSLTLGSSLEIIGDRAFSFSAAELTTLVIPNSVREIGEYAFAELTSLAALTVGEGVQAVGIGAFYGLVALTELNWNATEVSDLANENRVFDGVGKDSTGVTMTVGKNVAKIPAHLFHTTPIADAEPNVTQIAFESPIESALVSIGTSAFLNCRAVVVGLPPCAIDDYAFDKTTVVYFFGEYSDFAFSGNNIPRGEQYYYSAEEPAIGNSDRWHYAEDGKTPLIWD